MLLNWKFGPVIGTDDRSLLSKLQQNRTSSYAKSEHFRENTDRSVKYQPCRWDCNFAHRLRWSKPSLMKISVIPEFQKREMCILQTGLLSAKYRSGTDFFGIFCFNLVNVLNFNRNYQANQLIHSYGKFDIWFCKIPTKQVTSLKFEIIFICQYLSLVKISS